MYNPELEKKLKELKQKKLDMVQKFTRQSIDAINQCEEISMTHMSLADSNCKLDLKLKKKGLDVDDETDED